MYDSRALSVFRNVPVPDSIVCSQYSFRALHSCLCPGMFPRLAALSVFRNVSVFDSTALSVFRKVSVPSIVFRNVSVFDSLIRVQEGVRTWQPYQC